MCCFFWVHGGLNTTFSHFNFTLRTADFQVCCSVVIFSVFASVAPQGRSQQGRSQHLPLLHPTRWLSGDSNIVAVAFGFTNTHTHTHTESEIIGRPVDAASLMRHEWKQWSYVHSELSWQELTTVSSWTLIELESPFKYNKTFLTH